jgi:hypothetical protein
MRGSSPVAFGIALTPAQRAYRCMESVDAFREKQKCSPPTTFEGNLCHNATGGVDGEPCA